MTIRSLLERWWRPVLFGAWVLALSALLTGRRYTAFLRPEFGYILGLGLFTLLGFLATVRRRSRPQRLSLAQALRALILLLPLAYVVNGLGFTLDAYAFQNRSLGLPTVDLSGSALGTVKAATGPVVDITIKDLYIERAKYDGKRVRLTGMLHKGDKQIRKTFGRDIPVIFRFIVSCCTADASPGSVLVDGNVSPRLEESSWVEVEGVLMLVGDHGVPVIVQATVKATNEPKEPYLY